MFKSLTYDISETSKLFKQNRTLELRGLSNRLIKEASIETDYAKAELGVIAYALHKIESKNHFTQNQNWGKVKSKILTNLESAIYFANNHEQKQFLSKLKNIIQSIRNVDSKIGNFAQNMYDKAKVKQASLAFSYGLSISQAAELIGADKKEVQSYIGFTKMIDEEQEVKTISSRVNELKKLVVN